jgi:hypothetical protein
MYTVLGGLLLSAVVVCARFSEERKFSVAMHWSVMFGDLINIQICAQLQQQMNARAQGSSSHSLNADASQVLELMGCFNCAHR